jgi:hypothetical protein
MGCRKKVRKETGRDRLSGRLKNAGRPKTWGRSEVRSPQPGASGPRDGPVDRRIRKSKGGAIYMNAPLVRSWLKSTVGRPRYTAFVINSPWVSKGSQHLYSVRLRSAPPIFFRKFPYVFRFLLGICKSLATTRTGPGRVGSQLAIGIFRRPAMSAVPSPIFWRDVPSPLGELSFYKAPPYSTLASRATNTAKDIIHFVARRQPP